MKNGFFSFFNFLKFCAFYLQIWHLLSFQLQKFFSSGGVLNVKTCNRHFESHHCFLDPSNRAKKRKTGF